MLIRSGLFLSCFSCSDQHVLRCYIVVNSFKIKAMVMVKILVCCKVEFQGSKVCHLICEFWCFSILFILFSVGAK